MRCENRYALTFGPEGYSNVGPCTKEAKSTRHVRLSLAEIVAGDTRKFKVERLCGECARAYDDARAEARWEARVS